MHLGMPLFMEVKKLTFKNEPSYMISSSIIKQRKSMKNWLILFCSLDNKDLPFLGTIWKYSENLMGSWQMS